MSGCPRQIGCLTRQRFFEIRLLRFVVWLIPSSPLAELVKVAPRDLDLIVALMNSAN
ncbi:hypothetical protein PJI20_10085 [Mycobacterium kansasii]